MIGKGSSRAVTFSRCVTCTLRVRRASLLGHPYASVHIPRGDDKFHEMPRIPSLVRRRRDLADEIRGARRSIDLDDPGCDESGVEDLSENRGK